MEKEREIVCTVLATRVALAAAECAVFLALARALEARARAHALFRTALEREHASSWHEE